MQTAPPRSCAVQLEPELYDRLLASARANARSLSAEIRAHLRVAMTAADPSAPPLRATIGVSTAHPAAPAPDEQPPPWVTAPELSDEERTALIASLKRAKPRGRPRKYT